MDVLYVINRQLFVQRHESMLNFTPPLCEILWSLESFFCVYCSYCIFTHSSSASFFSAFSVRAIAPHISIFPPYCLKKV